MVYLFNSDVTLKSTNQLDAFGRLRVSQPVTLFDSQQRFNPDPAFESNTATSGSVTFIPTQSSCNLTVVNSTGSFAARESSYVFKYQPGKSLLSTMTFVMAPISSGNLRQRVGYFGSDNGFYIELSDALYLVQRSNSTGTVVNTAVANTSWNGDKLDGTGASGINLDITKAQILFTDIEWLGVGDVRCGFILNGQYVTAHTFKHANISSCAYMTTACLPLRYEIQSLGTGGPATANLTQVCSTVISEGGYNQAFQLFSNLAYFNSSVGASTWVPVLSMQLTPSRLDAIAVARQIDVMVTSTGDTVQWGLWANVVSTNLTGASFSNVNSGSSVQIDSSATALNPSTCYQIASGMASAALGGQGGMASQLELQSYLAQVGRNSFTKTSEILTLAFFNPNNQGSLTAYALLSWAELL
jgi:hypothetical protein